MCFLQNKVFFSNTKLFKGGGGRGKIAFRKLAKNLTQNLSDASLYGITQSVQRLALFYVTDRHTQTRSCSFYILMQIGIYRIDLRTNFREKIRVKQ